MRPRWLFALSPSRCVTLHSDDPAALAKHLPKYRQRLAPRAIKNFGTPIVVPERGTNLQAEEIVETMNKYGYLPWTYDPDAPHQVPSLWTSAWPFVFLIGAGTLGGTIIGAADDLLNPALLVIIPVELAVIVLGLGMAA